MKKVILSVLVASAVISLNAQDIRFGVTAGATFATAKQKFQGLSVTSDSKVGFTIGGLVDVPLANQFAFQPALNFTMKGGKQKLSFEGELFESNTSLGYIELPLNFLFRTEAGTGKFFAGVGPTLGMGISGKLKNKTTIGGQTVTEERDVKWGSKENEDDLKPFEFSGNILAGYEFSNGVFIAANYNLGFSNIAVGGNSDNSVKNRYFGVRLGFKFGGQGKK